MFKAIRNFLLSGLILLCDPAANFGDEFQVRVVDAKTKKPISVRMSIRNSRGALIKQRGVPFHSGNFCFFGKHDFKLPRGIYSYTIEKGLEYRTVSGQFEIKRGANDGVTVSIPRYTNLTDKGWWSGDPAVLRPLADLPILMDANGLNFANAISANNEGLLARKGFPESSFKTVNPQISFGQTGIMDSRLGGSLVWIGLEKQIPLPEPDSPSLLQISPDQVPEKGFVFVDHAAAWDLPVLLADSRLEPERQLHGIAIASGSLTASSRKKVQRALRPVPKQFPGEHKFARWQMAIYFHALNCGFKVPPVGCSGSGKSPNPVGYNRTYVHTGQEYSPEQWIKNFRQGRVLVTNGPVMNVLYNGILAGETFLVDEGKSIEIEPTLTLSLKEKAEYLEIIRNGFVAEQVSLDDYAKARGRLPKVKFTESGWMAIRVVTKNKDTYHFALSGPIYVEVGSAKVLKKDSAKFFLDWIVERAKMLKNSELPDKDKLVELMRPAYDFWSDQVKKPQNSRFDFLILNWSESTLESACHRRRSAWDGR